MDASFLLDLAPACTLAVEHSHNTRALVHVPYLEQAAENNRDSRTLPPVSDISLVVLSLLDYLVSIREESKSDLVPSRAGSLKRLLRVGRPGSWARRTDPSGRTNFFSRLKLWRPGLSLIHRIIRSVVRNDS